MFSYIDYKAVEALLHGQGCANNLKTLLENREISSVSIQPLVNTILDSFSLALSSMNSPNPPPYHESSFQYMASHVSRRSSKKKVYGAEGLENYRDDSPTPRPDDGFSWRKYGQKTIKTSPHQRSYYRCTYAKDHNCNASKRVQKIKDNPPVYRSTYVGKHVCKAPAFAVNDDAYGSEMIQFDQVVSEPVMPQLATIDHQAIAMEDQGTDHMVHIINQDCDINDSLVDDEPFWASYFPPLPTGDLIFWDNIVTFD
ncbi:putative WRKY transcription factor 64 [Cardamine amara subsp. amara]|uniref:WRKY transcription factor 64 n=1 Tax=Cardamine amara subsp. amara TaxID=228776 RepID=A0ABD1C124_CARAN